MNDAFRNEDLFLAVRACDLGQVLEARGYGFKPGGGSFFEVNPLRDERTSSIHVRTDDRSRWYDFGTSEGGDLLDFLQAAEGFSPEEARVEAARVLGVGPATSSRHENRGGSRARRPSARERVAPVVLDLRGTAEQAHAALLRGSSRAATVARAYLKHRGLDLDGTAGPILRNAMVGVIDDSVDLPDAMSRYTFRDRITFPYLDGERVPFLNARAAAHVDPHEAFRKPSGAHQTLPYNRHSFGPAMRYVVVVESEIDALSTLVALGADAPVLASGGGPVRPEHLKAITGDVEHVLLLYDQDASGDDFAAKTADVLRELDVATARLTLPDGCKDANDALRQVGADALAVHLHPQIDAARGTSDAKYISTTFLEELQRRHDRPFPSYPTGLDPIDRLLDGGYHEGLHVIGGITGGGKTSFALRLALHNALEGRPVIYASFEQSKHELWSRLAASVTRLPFGALKRGTYQERDGTAVPAADVLRRHAAFETLRHASEKLVILEAGDALSRRDGEHSLDDLRTLAQRLLRDTGMPPLVIVDYLQRVYVKDLAGREIRERVAYVAGHLQVALARDLGCPVLALSSLARSGYHNGARSTVEARLSSLKESGDIEYSAYTVALLSGFKEGEEPPELVPGPIDKWKPVSFDLAKNREGPSGTRLLRWTPIGDEWAAAEGVRW